MSGLFVQYGCGFSAPQGWRNFDASPTLRFERIPLLGRAYSRNGARFPTNVEYGNIVSGLPLQENSCDGVYCSHVLEHLALEEFRIAIKNTYRILAEGGCFRFVLPDLEGIVNEYTSDPSPDAAIKLMRETILGKELRTRKPTALITEFFGNHRHLWMWDYKSVSAELERIGFCEIRRARFGDASNPEFNAAENESRWDGALGVECRKPKSMVLRNAA